MQFMPKPASRSPRPSALGWTKRLPSKNPNKSEVEERKMGKDYKIGYGKPPEHSRFAKGRSGNPKGRPKGRKNLETDLDERLGEKITIREGDQTRKVSKQLG